MINLVEKLRYTPSKGISVWGDLQARADAIEALKSALEECRKSNSIVSKAFDLLERERDEYQQAADKMAMDYKVERDTLRQQLAEAQAEIKRLQVEVYNRNRRAMEGDKAEAAFDRLYVEHEELRIQVEASRKQEPVAEVNSPINAALLCKLPMGTKLYAAPAIADTVQRDAERYKFLRDHFATKSENSVDDFIALEPMTGEYFDAHIDILMSEFHAAKKDVV